MFNPFDYQSANGLGGMDSFGVQTAVLGMLSLRNGTNDFANSSGFITGVGGGNKPQHQQQRQNGSNTTLPLTPPGSPGDEERLVITDSASKQSPDSSSQHYQNGQGRLELSNRSAVQNLESQFLKHEINGGETAGSRNMIETVGTTAGFSELPSTSDPSTIGSTGGFSNCYSSPYYSDDSSMDGFLGSTAMKSPLTLSNSGMSRRHNRTEKKPIPAELKDEKYYERRKKNNVAAKKSRDTRKRREDDIAMRCAMLEQQNTVLSGQIAILREEAANLRRVLMQKRQIQAMQLQNGTQQQIPNMSMG